MTRWGLVLLIAYVAFGLLELDEQRATKIVIWGTIVVIAGAGYKFGAL